MTAPSAVSSRAARTTDPFPQRLPPWLRQEIPDERSRQLLRSLSEKGLHTVCREARCPNAGRCLKNAQLTFMILGPVCTRACAFCAVASLPAAPGAVQGDEPQRISRIAQELCLTYAVITSVTRDDLDDGGAGHFVRTVEALRRVSAILRVEVLVPDFCGRRASVDAIAGSPADVIGHNLETVPRLYARLRPGANYRRSLELLGRVKACAPETLTKSSLMLGMGETEEEVTAALRDLRSAGCDILTLGQYLAPSKRHYPVQAFIAPEQFSAYRQKALTLGFRAALCGPLVRSSYCAEEVYKGLSHA